MAEESQAGKEQGAGPAMERICPGCYMPLPKNAKGSLHGRQCYTKIQRRAGEILRKSPAATFGQVVEYAGPLGEKDYRRLSRIYQSGKGIAGLKKEHPTPEPREPAKAEPKEAKESLSGPEQTATPQEMREAFDELEEGPSFVRRVAHGLLAFGLSRLLPEYVKAREHRLTEREADLAKEWDRVRFLEGEVRRAEADLKAAERIQLSRIKVLRGEAEQEVDLKRRDLAGRAKAFQTEMEHYTVIIDNYDRYRQQAGSVPGLLAELERLKKEGETATLRQKDLEAELQTERSRNEMLIRERATKAGA